MTKDETRALVFMLQAAYPTRSMDANTQRMQLMLWHEALAEYPARIVNHVVKEWIFAARFYPSISEIRDAVREEDRIIRQSIANAEAEVALWEEVVSGHLTLRDEGDAIQRLKEARETLRRAEYGLYGDTIGVGDGSEIETRTGTAGVRKDETGAE